MTEAPGKLGIPVITDERHVLFSYDTDLQVPDQLGQYGFIPDRLTIHYRRRIHSTGLFEVYSMTLSGPRLLKTEAKSKKQRGSRTWLPKQYPPQWISDLALEYNPANDEKRTQ